MFKTFFTVLLLFVLILSMSAIAGNFELQRVHKVTAEDEARLNQKIKNSTFSLNIEKLPNELGRTWYDYATNNVMGRMMAYALDSQDGQDGIHFAFNKIATNGGTRYVTYDYFDFSFGLFLGNQSVTENQATGWGRVLNGVNDEALIIMHGGGLHLYQDASEVGYNFTETFTTAGGVFPGFARTGNTVFLMGQLANANWLGGDTVAVSTDNMSSWTGHNIWPPDDPAMTDYGTGEMWPTINPVNNTDISVVYCPDITAAAPNGITKMATTSDWGANWTLMDIHNDDAIVNGNQQFIIENFGQYNSMYGQDGTYHVVIGAVQGVWDTLASTDIDYFPLLYWNTREQTFVELSDITKSHPSDTAGAILRDNRPGNGLGGFNYPTLSEGPNGELVCIWQEWEDDGTGVPIVLNPAGGFPIFSTDIWGAFSSDGGMTWGAPFFVTGTAGESDVFPNITPTFQFNTAGDSAILDIAYMWDTNAGVSLFAGGNDPSEAIWYYERVAIPVTPNSVDENDLVLNEFKLSQNYPNPFNPSTNIKFSLSKTTDVTLDVFNVLGEKVATLINGKVKAGETVATFDGSNEASGVYYYQLTAGDLVQTKKMLLVK
jgi:hypothetical protein